MEPLSHAVSLSNPSNPLDVTQAFALIDRILSFEACLYHEIIPLFLENRTLHLGMVTLTDVSALDYARKILLFLNYSLTPHVVSSELHHQLLSQYLQFKGQADPQKEEQTIFYESDECERLRSLMVPAAAPVPPRPSIDRETLIVEAPEAIEDWLVDPIKPAFKPTLKSSLKPTVPLSSLQTASSIAPIYGDLDRRSVDDLTLIQSFNDRDQSLALSELSTALPTPALPAPALPTPGDSLPILSVKTTYADASPEVLQGLDSTELLENLLGRVLTSGIGRLYFEYQSDSGRVLSSTNGILQSLIEHFPIARFESLIWALKNLMKVSPEPVTEPMQVEIERWHEKNRLLLRLRLMPQWEGEEVVGEDATLQILRGAALRFYQQQQTTNLRRDTFLVAKNLQLKVQALQERSNHTANSPP